MMKIVFIYLVPSHILSLSLSLSLFIYISISLYLSFLLTNLLIYLFVHPSNYLTNQFINLSIWLVLPFSSLFESVVNSKLPHFLLQATLILFSKHLYNLYLYQLPMSVQSSVTTASNMVCKNTNKGPRRQTGEVVNMN